MRPQSWLLPAALALFGLHCADGTGPTSAASGQVVFDFVGDTTGRFSARGALTLAADSTIRQPFALARRLLTGDLMLCAFAPVAPSAGDVFALNLGAVPGPGIFALPVPPAPRATWLFYGNLLLGANLSAGSMQRILPLITGEVTIRDTTGGRVRGTFSGLFGNLDPRYTPVDTVRVSATTATFDVPVVTGDDSSPPDSLTGQRPGVFPCNME